MYNTITEQATLKEIKEAFAELNARMEELEAKEPKNENSPEYEAWAEECENLAFRSELLMTWIDRKTAAGLS